MSPSERVQVSPSDSKSVPVPQSVCLSLSPSEIVRGRMVVSWKVSKFVGLLVMKLVT